MVREQNRSQDPVVRAEPGETTRCVSFPKRKRVKREEKTSSERDGIEGRNAERTEERERERERGGRRERGCEKVRRAGEAGQVNIKRCYVRRAHMERHGGRVGTYSESRLCTGRGDANPSEETRESHGVDVVDDKVKTIVAGRGGTERTSQRAATWKGKRRNSDCGSRTFPSFLGHGYRPLGSPSQQPSACIIYAIRQRAVHRHASLVPRTLLAAAATIRLLGSV
ncbi:hypothetical protein ALC60_06819 [Trachymyrmex zeteki]|uniref:Uncharacterized protein n=1 Tax=Mycetomoellerius zeteki TaxID=64791 RepID=A0A151X1V9_9HYME|nr:hypothetical protein ALC60_06819 [Trachymyrmex zeteki]